MSDLINLQSTADNLRASIAARESQPKADQTPDFQAVTAGEKARLAEIEKAITAAQPKK
jgi:predicted kinase